MQKSQIGWERKVGLGRVSPLIQIQQNTFGVFEAEDGAVKSLICEDL